MKKLSDDNPDDLINAYLDERLPPSDRKRFAQWLKANPANLEDFAVAVHDHQMLRQTLVAEAVLKLSDFKPTRNGDAPRRRRSAAGEEIKRYPASSVRFQCMALAASLAFLVVTVFYLFTESKVEERSVAALVELRSTVEIERNQEVFPAKRGDALREGDLVRTGPDAAAVVIYPDFSRIELAADSEVTFRSGLDRKKDVAPSAKHLWFHRGSLKADMAKQPVGRPVEFQMPNATVTVRGTVLGISTSEDRTSVAVREGAVALRRYTDGTEELVSAGGKAEALGPAFNPNYGRLVFLQNFDSIAADELVAGAPTRLPSPEGEVTAIAAVRFHPEPGSDWRPDYWIDFRIPYTIPDNIEIRVRLRSERPGKWFFVQTPSNVRFQNEHFGSRTIAATTEWRDYVFHADDIEPYRRAAEGNTRDFLPGTPIQGVGIYGNGTGVFYVDRFEVISRPGGPKTSHTL